MRKELLHCKHLTETIQYLEHIKLQAEYYSDSFFSIIQRIDTNDISLSFSKIVSSGVTPLTAWEIAVNDTKLILSAEEKQIIINFGNNICSSSVENLSNVATGHISELIKRREQLVNEREKKTKLSSALTLSIGLIIVLILI